MKKPASIGTPLRKDEVRTLIGMCSLTLALCGCVSTKPISSSFEKRKIDKIWKTGKIAGDAARVQDEVVREGRYAIEMKLNQGQIKDIGRDGTETERTELKEKWKHQVTFGETYWYAFSFFLPSDFPIVDRRLVIGQWKQHADRDAKKSPLIAQRFVGGVFTITSDTDAHGRQVLYRDKKGADLRGRWIDMVYRVRFSGHKDGTLQVWMNDRKVVDYSGVLGNLGDLGRVYFKFGLYRDKLPIPMTVYFDRYRRGKNPCEIGFSLAQRS